MESMTSRFPSLSSPSLALSLSPRLFLSPEPEAMQLGDWEPVWAVWLAHTPPWWSEYITGNIEGNCIISQFSLTHPINKIDTWERYTNKHHVWTSANLASIYKTIDLRFINLALSQPYPIPFQNSPVQPIMCEPLATRSFMLTLRPLYCHNCTIKLSTFCKSLHSMPSTMKCSKKYTVGIIVKQNYPINKQMDVNAITWWRGVKFSLSSLISMEPLKKLFRAVEAYGGNNAPSLSLHCLC